MVDPLLPAAPARRSIGLVTLPGSAVGWPAHLSPDPFGPAGFGRGTGDAGGFVRLDPEQSSGSDRALLDSMDQLEWAAGSFSLGSRRD